MGLTVHYTLKYTGKSPKRPAQLVERMRQLALDLPFDEVTDIVDISGQEISQRIEDPNDPLQWLLIQAGDYFTYPWNDRKSQRINAERAIAFTAIPGPGSEPVNLGLCVYPKEITLDYCAFEDQKFLIYKEGGRPQVNTKKYFKWKNKDPRSIEPGPRTVPTKFSGWQWQSFCKTQYASNPACGGLANFLKCHISVITLLDRIAELPAMKVTIEDEGKYGPSTYSDDWEEAYAEGRQPTYVWHPATYNVKTLTQEVGDYNELVASLGGLLKDKAGAAVKSPIFDYQNFEQLEFKGQKNVNKFLDALSKQVNLYKGEA
ncbi:MAG: hypothetical protein DWQ19_08745 [Crenarchaeota archaeon]|nr:MAG: hypothetical protein DWQ19_08745 [Thermoproteota archaeon]